MSQETNCFEKRLLGVANTQKKEKKAKNSQLELQLMLLLFFLRSPLLFRWEISQAKENKSKLVVSLVYYVCFCFITEKKKAVVSKKGRKKKLRIQKTSTILCAKKLGKTKKNAVSYYCYLFFSRAMMCTGAIYLCWCFLVCCTVLSFANEKPNIIETVRNPTKGKKWSDYDYKTDVADTNIFFFMWLATTCALIAPYEILILELSHDDLLGAQELNHAAISTNWNKQNQKDTGCPIYSYWQLKIWKNLMFNYLKPLSTSFNLAIGCALEAMFCWLAYAYTWNNGFIWRRMNIKTWVWSYHFLEEIEHTHISVPEMRQGLSIVGRIATCFVFDLFIIIPIMLILTPITVVRYFPSRFFSIYGVIEFIEFLLATVLVVPFVVIGQFCEMVLCLNWKASALEGLWKEWYDSNYAPDCIDGAGKEMFEHSNPHPDPDCSDKVGKKVL